MNNRGFTLIELVTIIFIAMVVATIGAISLSSSLDRQELEADEMAAYSLTDSTESYALVSGTSLDYYASDFVFSDCESGGSLNADLMIGKLMENGFLISKPSAQTKNAEFQWDITAQEWKIVVSE